jgi:Spy/CpxP family protein refolding chaperone
LLARSNAILIAAVLAAGLALGFAVSTFAYRSRLLELPGENLVERMNKALSLDPSQREQIAEVMEDTRAQVMDLRRKLQHQRRRLMIAAYLRVRSILNPNQQKKFDDEFVPPRFRAEARQADQNQGAPSIGSSESSPAASPSP